MVTLGVDWGERRIGVAFANDKIAAPWGVLTVKNAIEAVKKTIEVLDQLGATKVVLGIPFVGDGEEGVAARKAKQFGQRLRDELGVEVIFWDESLSSQEALAGMLAAGRGKKARRGLDAASAAVILQDYLDAAVG